MPRVFAYAGNLRGRLARSGDDGAAAAEYVLIATLIAVAIIGAVTLLGNQVATFFNQINGAF
jgi:Flp pilus assembly pilin Flp